MAVSSGRSGRSDYGSGRKQCCLRTDHDALYHCILYAESKRRQTGCYPGWMCEFCIPWTVCRDTERYGFTTEYSVRTAMEAVYGLLGVDRGVPEVWGSVYDIRELLDSTVKLMDGKSPLDIELPGPLNLVKKPLLKMIHGTVVEKVLEDHDIIRK